jgi:hypothetical protein
MCDNPTRILTAGDVELTGRALVNIESGVDLALVSAVLDRLMLECLFRGQVTFLKSVYTVTLQELSYRTQDIYNQHVSAILDHCTEHPKSGAAVFEHDGGDETISTPKAKRESLVMNG